MTAGAGAPAVTAIPRQELRIAMVLNGGVSLAVWIGGVVREFSRLTAARNLPKMPAVPARDGNPALPAQRSIYQGLCALLAYDPQVDVIAGTSAGAVNGAYLALATSRLKGEPFDQAMRALREVWMEDGAIQGLMRSPLEAKPPSLLDGDGYYYGRLQRAFDGLRKQGARNQTTLDLIMTTTLIEGEPQYLADDFGSSIPDVTHRGTFHFHGGPPGAVKDHFNEPEIADQLAVAARSSSSFPAAFEPSFCPIGGPADGRPDMTGIASFQNSRYLIDGGILDNRPLDVALKCIFARHSSAPARRVLAYISPNPGTLTMPPPDKPGAPPGLLSVVFDSLVSIPMVQSIAAQVDQLQSHNKAVREKRRQRTVLACNVSPASIDDMSGTLFNAYRQARIERALEDIIDGLNEGLSKDPKTMGIGRKARRRAMQCILFETLDTLPWVPTCQPLHWTGEGADAAARERTGNTWKWGVRPVQHLSRLAFDLLVRAEAAGLATSADGVQNGLWKTISAILTEVDSLRAQEHGYWETRYLDIFTKTAVAAPAPNTVNPPDDSDKDRLDQSAFEDALKHWGTEQRESAADLAQRIAHFVNGLPTPPDDGATAAPVERCDDPMDAYRRLHAYFVRPDDPAPSDDLVLARLLAFTVIDDATAAEGEKSEEIVEFIQVSGDDDEITGRGRKATDKLNGTQLADFAAFYKASWRANDWCWGRRDAVGRILRVMIDPERLRVCASALAPPSRRARAVMKRLKRMRGVDAVLAADPAWRRKMMKELAYLGDPAKPAPDSLDATLQVLAQALETEILEDELPQLAEAIYDSDEQRNTTGSTARELLFAYRRRVRGLVPNILAAWNAPPGQAVLERFRLGNGLGEEKWEAEVGTDPSAFVATRMLAVGTAALGADGGLALLGPVLVALRVPTLMLYAMARNACMGSRIGLAINTALLIGAAGVLTAAAIWGVGAKNVPMTYVVPACAVLIGAMILMTIRLRTVWRWIVVTGIVFAMTGWAAFELQRHWAGLKTFGAGHWIVVAMAEAVMIVCAFSDRLLGLRTKVQKGIDAIGDALGKMVFGQP